MSNKAVISSNDALLGILSFFCHLFADKLNHINRYGKPHPYRGR